MFFHKLHETKALRIAQGKIFSAYPAAKARGPVKRALHSQLQPYQSLFPAGGETRAGLFVPGPARVDAAYAPRGHDTSVQEEDALPQP